MLGWMLKRGDNASGEADTDQAEQPDTPAPVFAARALKRAVFGTPQISTDQSSTANRATQIHSTAQHGGDTPSKPQGILLTPGTATAKRKSVSFGHEVGIGGKSMGPGLGAQSKSGRATSQSKLASSRPANKSADSDSEWEEDEEDGQGNFDITLDLNEPRSQSGQFWKEELNKYQRDAKMEMDKLLEYKKLAKSYAQQRDAEAVQLAEMLRAEQQKVSSLEAKMAANASKIVLNQEENLSEAPAELVSKLTKQTALARQYRKRVQEMEEKMAAFLRGKESEDDHAARRRKHIASPRSQTAPLETQRELRRAKAQVKELGDLRAEVRSLKKELREAKRHKDERPKEDAEADGTSSRARELRSQLREARHESSRLREELESLRKDSQQHADDMKGVLERAHDKIAELKKELKTLKAAKADGPSLEAGASNRAALREASPQRHIGKSHARSTSLSPSKSRQQPTLHSGEEAPSAGRSAAQEHIGQPKWQAFVPRSPRDRAYLGSRLEAKIQNGGYTPAPLRERDVVNSGDVSPSKRLELGTEDRDAARDGEIDLLKTRFAQLSDKPLRNASSSTALTKASTGSSLSADRRAAAMARIEQRMAGKMAKDKVQRLEKSRWLELDKENLRP